MNDLSQLFELNPYVASGFLGQREAIGQNQEQLRSQELAQLISSRQQDAAFKAQQHPLDLEKLMLANKTTEAQLPGVTADSRKKGLEADLKAGTLPSDIESGISKNKAEAYKRLGSHLGSISGLLDGVSDVEAPMVLSQAFDAIGAPPQVKQSFMQRYARLPAAEMVKRMQADSEKILRENDSYAQAYDTTALTQDAHIITNAATNASHERVAEADRQAGKFERKGAGSGKEFDESQAWGKRVADSRSARERHSAALGAVEFWKAQGNEGKAGYYQGIADSAEAQARAEIAASNLKPGEVNLGAATNGAVPVNPEVSIRTPKPAAPASATSSSGSVQQEAMKAWGSFEPNKYEYRFNNGKLQRRAK